MKTAIISIFVLLLMVTSSYSNNKIKSSINHNRNTVKKERSSKTDYGYLKIGRIKQCLYCRGKETKIIIIINNNSK